MAAMTASCRTNDLNPDKGEVGGSSPPKPTIQITSKYAAIYFSQSARIYHQKPFCQKFAKSQSDLVVIVGDIPMGLSRPSPLGAEATSCNFIPCRGRIEPATGLCAPHRAQGCRSAVLDFLMRCRLMKTDQRECKCRKRAVRRESFRWSSVGS